MADDSFITLDDLALKLVCGGDGVLEQLQGEFKRFDAKSRLTPSGSPVEGPTCYEVFHPKKGDIHCTPNCFGVWDEHEKNLRTIAGVPMS